MAESDISEEIRQKIEECGQADIVIGIPSFNNAATIGNTVRITTQGLQQFFPSSRSMIVQSDGGSKDGSGKQAPKAVKNPETLLQAPYHPGSVQNISTRQSGISSKGKAFRMLFQIAKMLGAKACAVVDSDIQSMTPDWIRSLVQPVLEGKCDYVSPYYARGKLDGAINNSIVYPMTRALYGKQVRYPMGGEFCVSPIVRDYCLNQDTWEGSASSFGIEIWMTTQALCGGFRTAQSYLGKKIRDPKEPVSDLSSVLKQILGVLFAEIEKNARVWQRIRGSEAIPMFGNPEVIPSASIKVDAEQMIDSYKLGFKNLIELWSPILPPAALLELKKLAQCTTGDFVFPDPLWARIVYDFAVAFHLKTMNRDHLISALTPLYLGWVASFLLQMRSADAAQADARIEELCRRYETEKPYLISRWRWPDRFNP
jgi:glycosyltransferase involved in cell wall biosynthesis